jgi:GTP-binding protein Era
VSDTRRGFDEFATGLREEARRAWEEMPEGTRAELQRLLDLLPKDIRGWRGLIDQAVEHLRVAAGSKGQVAIVGPVNVGKSTLYNQLIRSRRDQAAVSAVPGTTRRVQGADAGIFGVIDTPGADAVGAVGMEEKVRALGAAQTADLIILVFDAAHGVQKAEQDLYAEIAALGKPTVVALNKIDLVGKERAGVIGKAAAALNLRIDQVLPISAKGGMGLDRLLVAVAKSEPGIVAALGAALPEYRFRLAQAVIVRAGSTAAAIAVTPLPLADFIPLVALQAAMVMSIARIYAYRITLARAKEIIAAFGVGMLGRTLFYEVSKLGGPPGWLVAAAVAAGTTVAMGYASAVWFDRGERLSGEALARIARAVSQEVIDRLRGLGKRRPGRITLRQRVSEALEELSASEGSQPHRVEGDQR